MKTLISLTAAWVAATGLLLASCNRQNDSGMPSGPGGNAAGDHETAAGGGVEGTVVSNDNGTLVMVDRQGKESRYKVGGAVDVSVNDKGVDVNVNGKRLRGGDLKKGMQIRVNANKDGEATTIFSVPEPNK